MRPPKRILVPTDFSDASTDGVRAAADVARRFGASLTLIHVDASAVYLAAVRAAATGLGAAQEAVEEYRQSLALKLLEFLDENVGKDTDAAPLLAQDDDPARGILSAARDRGMDWIVMSAAGRTGWRAALMGSTAARVVRDAPVPVLTVRERGKTEGRLLFDDYQNVLAATDLDEHAAPLIAAAADLAAPRGQLVLLHVVEAQPVLGLYGVPLRVPAEDLAAAREWAEAALTKLVGDRGTVRVAEGRPVDRILAAEEELDPDLVVVGTHGRHGFERVALGSVAEGVVARARNPVLVVPTGRTGGEDRDTT